MHFMLSRNALVAAVLGSAAYTGPVQAAAQSPASDVAISGALTELDALISRHLSEAGMAGVGAAN